ncbi:SDR family NAD(P)-dependent oxidoreductase [Gynuella sunshinyii]|uniref:PKS n=1 Tax=Gynuella sunshinyii YC6258 TaxID=1445510 RepID=A0A0C5V8V4_9GAMM|nr:SDR family NAD(P)-dependent oxidoreductase [Gynuella sunshinyii]AJQ95775.1 polyketide synthase modules-related protein [Gynuella sunshinyii YC6258]DAC80062.1 TPA_exp: PKS [Gynuella sunshinyii YC6258]
MFKDHFHQELQATLTAEDYPVAHHLVHGVRLLPGVFLIDLIYRAMTQFGMECRDVLLKKITFREPVSLGLDDAPDSSTRRIILIFDGSAESISVQVISHAAQQSRDQARQHLKADIVPAHGKMLFHPQLPDGVPMTMDADEVYRFARQVEIVHHEFMKPQGRICHLDHGTFASVELGELAKASMHNFLLQPVFMDFATLVPFSPDVERYTQAYIPIYIERIQVAKPLQDKCRVYAPLSQRGPESDDILYHDIFLYDEHGDIALIFERFGAKRIRNRDLIHALLPMADDQSARSPTTGKNTATTAVSPSNAEPQPSLPAESADVQLQQLILQILGEKLGKPGESVDQQKSFYESGLSSVDLLDFVTQLEQRLDLELYPTLLFEHTSVAQLHEYLLPQVQNSAIFTTHHSAPAVTEKPDVSDTSDAANAFNTQPAVAGTIASVPQLDQVIAMVGIAGRFAQSGDLPEFWQHLLQGHDLVTDIPADRWSQSGFYSATGESGKSNSRWGSFIQGVDEFDPLFFAISPLDAERMDPQERLFMQTAWHALEDASMAPGSVNHVRDTGVFCGVMWSDYQLFGHEALLDRHPALASSWFSSIPNRVSYCFDFTGPSLPIDTACSSALHAIHLACDSLRRGECQAALAGAVNLSLHPSKYIKLSTLQMLSPTGRCRPFAEGADGYVPGEGVGAVVLKPLAQALRDGHHIYGLIRGSAISHGGRTAGFSVPNHKAQSDTFTMALQAAGMQPDDIDYLETHGTGTRIGDPIEVNGIKETFHRFAQDADTPTLLIGSVKSNVGHLEAAAGMASLAKVVLAMHHGRIPKSLYTETLNPLIRFQQSPVIPVQALQSWPDKHARARTAAIASFGAGGANSYLIIEQYLQAAVMTSSHGPQWIPFSAPNRQQLLLLMRQFAGYLSAQSPSFALERLAASLQWGRKRLAHRLVVLAADPAELHERLLMAGNEDSFARSGFYYDGKQLHPAQINDAHLLPAEAQAWLTGELPVRATDAPIPCLPFLPGYPFTRKRYWINADRTPASLSLAQLAADHQLLGEPVVPGMYYLSRVIEQSDAPLCARQLKWLLPLVCEQQSGDAEITAAQLHISEQNGEWQISHGDRLLCRMMTAEAEEIDLDACRQRLVTATQQCRQELVVADCYRQLQQMGIAYGDSLRVHERILRASGAVTVQFKSGTGRQLTALLDGALQATALLLPVAADQQIRLPFAVQSLWLSASLAQSVAATLISRPDHTFDIGFFDAEQQLTGLLQQVKLLASEIATVQQTLAQQHRQPWLQFASRWCETPLPISASQDDGSGEGIILAFVDQPADAVINNNQNIYRVVPGTTFSTEQQLITLDEHQDSHYVALVEYLREICKTRQTTVSTILYQPRSGPDGRHGFACLLDLMRAWYRLKQKATVTALFLYQADQYADACAVTALAKTAMLELPTFRLKALAVSETADIWSNGLRESTSGSGVHVRYDGQRRYEQRTLATVPTGVAHGAFKHHGSYVISGGLGGLGILFARHLLQHYQARIVLVGRRPDSAEIQMQCQSLQALGGTVAYMSADVCETADLQRIIATARQAGNLNGWIHCAGVIRDALLPFKQPQQIQEVLAPKVTAVEQLYQALQGQTLDCVVLCSSVSAMLGSKGQADYAAANGFMDGFAEQVSSPAQPWISINWPLWREGGMQIADSDIAVIEQAGLAVLDTETGLAMLEHAVSCGASQYMAMTGQQEVLTRRLAMVERQEMLPAESAHTIQNPPVATMATFAPVTSEMASTGTAEIGITDISIADRGVDSTVIQRQLRQLLSDILKLDDDDISVDEPFESYGIDSVQTVTLLEQIEARFQLTLSVSEFSDLNTLEKLAGHLAAEMPVPSSPIPTANPATAQPAVRPDRVAVSSTVALQPADAYDGIAIISLACRFPGATSVAELWSALQRPQPAASIRYGELCRQRGYDCVAEVADLPVLALPDSDDSEALEFTILQQLMQELIDQSGYATDSLAEQNVGVYIGAGSLSRTGTSLEQLLPASLASRISRTLGLNGPALVLDSACSSSVSALHQACMALRSGEVDMACAGAVNLLTDARIVAAMAAKGMLATDGFSRLFDSQARGFGLSEGAGLFLLKRLDQARRDGDNIVAVIRAIGLQNEGKSQSQALPNVKSLRRLMARTLEQSRISTTDIGYVDISGVGDQLIDVLELEAIRQVYETGQAFSNCVVTASKSHYGTALSASGVLSLLRCIAAMHQGAIPGQPHIQQLLARLPFTEQCFYPVTENTVWPAGSQPRCAVINNMGMGGTHGHIVLQQGSGVLEFPVVADTPDANRSQAVIAEPAAAATTEHAWTETLSQWLTRQLGLEKPVSADTTFEQLGLESFHIAELMTFIEQGMATTLSPSIFFDNPSVRTLAAYVASQSAHPPASMPVTPPTVARQDVPVADPPHPLERHSGQQSDSPPDTTIAITGMAVRLPGADTLDQFWQIIRDGQVVFAPVSATRPHLNIGAVHDRTAALLAEVRYFDGRFFGISPREANLMDPQLRLALETVYHALEDANLTADIRGSDTGVFAGISFRDYEHLLRHHGAEAVAAHESTGNAASMLANRISYSFNLKGPSVAVDTACSSSLVALHQACSAIRQGECRQAIVLGANLLLSHLHFEHMEALGALSATGRCSVFDAQADGYVPGEGIVAIVIQAAASDQPVSQSYALISASAVNHAGKTNSITVPGMGQQQRLLQRCWQLAGTRPDYIETHGTGTPMGDPIEVDAIARAMAELEYDHRDQPCALGSVKACIGHTEAAAGLTGLIKTALMIHHGWLPAQPAFQHLNPKIQLPESLSIPLTGHPWEAIREQRVAAVSSFGFGGANAHVVLRGEQAHPPLPVDDGQPQLLMLSARTQTSLYQQAQRLQHHIEQAIEPLSLAAIARTLAVGRETFHERVVFMADSTAQLARLLEQFVDQNLTPGLIGQGSAELEQQARRWLTEDLPVAMEPGPLCRLPGYAFDGELCWYQEHDHAESPAPVLPVTRQTQLALYRDEWVALRTDSMSVAEGTILLCSGEAINAIRDQINGRKLNVPVSVLDPQRPLSGIAPVAGQVVKILYLAGEQDRRALDQGDMMPVMIMLQRLLSDMGEAVIELLYVSLQLPTPASHRMMSGLAHAVSGARPGLSMRCVFGTKSYADICRELFADEAPTCVSYRNRQRGYVHKHLINHDDQRNPHGFIRHGCYLVTGGLGSIGQLLCQYLASEYQANLIMIGRSAVSDHSQSVCRQLSGSGHDAVYLQVDVTDPEAVIGAVTYGCQRFGQIDAILHAAGSLHEGPLADKTAANFSDICASKILGLEHLLEAVRQLEPAPAIFAFSSISACLPSSQLADYAMANAFMDAKCEALNAQGMQVYSLQFPYWQEGGMQTDEVTLRIIMQQTGFEPLTADAGLRAIDQVVACPDQPVTLIAYGDQSKIQSVLDDAVFSCRLNPAVAALMQPAEAPAVVTVDGLVDELVDLIMQVLQLSQRPDPDVSLTDLGFESITVIELTRQLQQRFGIDVSGADLYSYRTLGDYLAYLQQQYGQTPHRPRSVHLAAAATARADTTVSTESVRSDAGAVEIVGMAARFPGAESLQQFWQNQLAGVDCIAAEFPSRMVGQQQPRHQGGGFIDQVECFDPAFFNMTQGQAEQTDPQQRLLLQCCWHALEDAGVVPEQLNGGKVGVFIGISNIEYREVLAACKRHNGHNVSGTSMSMAANSLSYFFNWTGPSETVDTGCSSSLVALHRARKAMADGDCDWAIVGGVNLLLSRDSFKACEDAGMLSPDQRCFTFDQQANGYVRGEGVGVVLLKSDRVDMPVAAPYANLNTTAINHNGKGQSLTAPSAVAQSELLQRIYAQADVDLEALHYIECHGTATELGDPIEINALKLAFSALGRWPSRCGLGTVKTHIGHLESAAGIAGIIRTALALYHEKRPGNLHFKHLNPHIKLADTPFYVQQHNENWPAHQARIAGVSSFGFGGVNAHALLAGRPPLPATALASQGPLLFVWSAATTESLQQTIGRFSQWLEQQPSSLNLHDVAMTLLHHRHVHDDRAVVEAGDAQSLQQALQQWLTDRSGPLQSSDQPIDVSGWQHADVAAKWLHGEAIRALLPATGHRILHLPGYAFAPTRCWPDDGAAVSPAADAIPRQVAAPAAAATLTAVMNDADVRQVIRQVFAEVTRQPVTAETPDRYFDEMLIDSITGLALVDRLADHFGPVSKTLLYEYKTIAELTAYFVSRGESAQAGAVEQQPDATDNHADERSIAIIGMAGQFATAADVEALWQLIQAGECGVREVPAERFDWRQIYGDPTLDDGKTNCKWGGFIDHVARFDPTFFGISPREAEAMDPQQRLFLVGCYQALEHAGYSPAALNGQRGGVFAGVSALDYSHVADRAGQSRSMHVASGLAHTVVANRVSYFLGLTGPSEIVDTACSSSLVSIHRAMTALQQGECDFALAGGVNLTLTEELFVAFGQSGFLSPTGRCHSFSDQADGYVRGEGYGVVMLKPLAQARRDGDEVLAVIRASGVNHGGRVRSLSVPNPTAQAALVQQVWRQAGVQPADVDYIEAHGTGTSLGDPIEIEGLKKACRELSSTPATTPSIGIGALKANIGHLESAAGVAGLIKILLCMRQQQLPAIAGFTRANPYLDLADSPLYLLDQPQPWPVDSNRPRIAALSSFGFGGTNAHMVIQAMDDALPSDLLPESGDFYLPVSAHDDALLQQYLQTLQRFFMALPTSQWPTVSQLAYVLQSVHDARESRVVFKVQDCAGFCRQLASYLSGDHSVTEATDARLQDWLQGSTDDWPSALRVERPARRLTVPSRPFGGERYWHDVAVNAVIQAQPIDEEQHWREVLERLAHGEVDLDESSEAIQL